MNDIKTIYRIPERNLAGLKHELEKLNRRALKLAVPAIGFRETGRVETVETKDKTTGLVIRVSRIIECELVGATPRFEGWTLAATLEHTVEGNIIRKVPSCSVDLMPFQSAKPVCEHCKLTRNRRDTYLVAHDSGAVKQIGHDCIRDFLGHKSPQGLAEMAELLFSAGELCSLGEDGEGFGSGTGRDLIYVRTLLGYTARAIRQYGFTSAKAEREAEEAGQNRQSTRSRVLTWMFPPTEPARNHIAQRDCLAGEVWPTPSPEDEALVDTARQYVLDTLAAKPGLSEFENNLLICAKLEAIEPRTAGIACFIVEYYRRETEKTTERAANQAKANNTHFGEVGKRYREIALSYLGCSSFESAFGICFIHKFENADGQRLVWKTGTSLGCADGAKVTATFTVKEHGEYKGWNQTKMSRAILTGKVSGVVVYF